MAERKTGPVKPPVIDLTARENKAEAEKPAAEPKPAKPVDTPPKADAAPVSVPPYLPLGIAAVAGGVIGAGLSLILAYGGAFPKAETDPRLDQLEARLAALSQSAGAETAQQIEGLSAEIAALKSAAPVDLAPLRQEIETLSGRLEAVAAGASGAEAEGLTQALSDLRSRLDAAEAKLSDGATTATALRGDFAALQQAVTDQQQAAASAQAQAQVVASQLPLVLAELDAALTAGRPYGGELAKLRALDPERAIPEGFAAAAERGLPRPDALVEGFRQALPGIAAAMPVPADAGWQDQGFAWLRNLLALRRSEEIAGDSPDAVLSRLEGAMERRDFAAAAPLFTQLPAPMLTAAGSLPADVTASAEAQALLAALRQQALTASATPEAGS